jgi:hypothetical protein
VEIESPKVFKQQFRMSKRNSSKNWNICLHFISWTLFAKKSVKSDFICPCHGFLPLVRELLEIRESREGYWTSNHLDEKIFAEFHPECDSSNIQREERRCLKKNLKKEKIFIQSK